MDAKEIIRNFKNLDSTKDIADKFNIDQMEVKRILRSKLGKRKYLEISHKIGAKKVYDAFLYNPLFRKHYSEKMKKSVRNSIKLRMRDGQFRTRWLKKAKDASKKGNDKIRDLLSNNSTFLVKWKLKCILGGIRTLGCRKGIHDPLNSSKRTYWSVLGLRKTGRKFLGPKKESMYNLLEVNVAEILSKSRIPYKYEKIIHVKNRNGFYSIDFVIPKNTIIEATYWSDIQQKSRELTDKFEYLKKNTNIKKFILVTLSSMSDGYKRFLPPYVIVLTLNELEKFIAGQRGRITK